MEPVFPFQPVHTEYKHTDHRRHSCGKHRSENPHIQRKNKQIVQYNVGQAPREHGKHGQSGIPVIPDKTNADIIQNKSGGKQHYHP